MAISIELIGSAFVMGLAGSLHCIGMCGPLALSLPAAHKSSLSRISGGLIYNSGRILSYTSMGLLFGSLGNLMIATRWQSGLSITLGMIILVYLLFPKRYFHFSAATILSRPFVLLRQQLGKLFQSKKLSSVFFIGVLNGFLPCGLVYLALTSSIISSTTVNGGMFMLFFGLGTFPMMFATVLMGNYLNQSIRRKIHKAVPALLFFMAVLLILRGMNLGIPFVSPELGNAHHQVVTPCR
ncbi:MAG TPA: sulfite exporter TauE/SafE family protein [Chitinophagaceae bacterium]|nr:sulfite exporter TauE/SafE family protein [Chitinophagaceae bacterium]